MTDIQTRFHRTSLLLGADALNRLRAAHVTVVGCGAVGSFAAEALVRAGVGYLTLIDPDTVERSNINRQLCALESTIGQSKTDVLAARIRDICPDTQTASHHLFVDQNTCAEAFSDTPDFVIDAMDSLTAKADMLAWLYRAGIPTVSAMGAALKTDFRRIRVAPLNQTTTCPVAARLRRLLKDRNIPLDIPCVYSDEPPVKATEPGRQMGSLITITGQFGLILADYAIHSLIKS